MSIEDLERLQEHPTPWASRYAGTHPQVVVRTLLRYGREPRGDSRMAPLGRALIHTALGALGLTVVLGLLWWLALDPAMSGRSEHPGIDAAALSLVLLPPSLVVMRQRLRAGYRSAMVRIHRAHPGAFLTVAQVWERGHETAVLRRAAAAATTGATGTTARPRKRL